MLILYDTQHFRGVDTINTKQYAVFSGGRYCLYNTIRSIFGRSILFINNAQHLGGTILFILSNTKYFRGFDTTYTKQYEVFSGVDTTYNKQYEVFSGVDTKGYWFILTKNY